MSERAQETDPPNQFAGAGVIMGIGFAAISLYVGAANSWSMPTIVVGVAAPLGVASHALSQALSPGRLRKSLRVIGELLFAAALGVLAIAVLSA